jgi:hypothetical protein
MATTVTSSIGTSGRDYSTLAAWLAACPADLVAADQIWRGECYNDAEFVSSSQLLNVSGITSDATRYPILTVATGQGFKANGGAATLPLRYDQSKGVGIRFNGGYAKIIEGGGILIVDGLQIKYDSSSSSNYSIPITGLRAMRNCIFETIQTANIVVNYVQEIANSVLVYNGATFSGTAVRPSSGTDRIINCTIVRPSDLTAGGTGIAGGSDGYPQVTNCAVFGFTTPFDGTIASYAAGSGNNASDVATTAMAGGSGGSNQGSLTYASQFESTTNASRDWRAAVVGVLETTGVRAQTYTADLDIIGASRSTTTPSIGAREYVTASTNYTLTVDHGQLAMTGQDVTLTATGNYALAVDHAQLAMQGQDVTMTPTGNLSLAVDHGQLALQGYDVLFILTATGSHAELAMQGQDVTLQLGSGYTLAVDHAQLAMQGQEVLFALSVVGSHAELALQGQDVGLLAANSFSLTVDHAQLAMQGQDIGLSYTGNYALAVEHAYLAFAGSNVVLSYSGLVLAVYRRWFPLPLAERLSWLRRYSTMHADAISEAAGASNWARYTLYRNVEVDIHSVPGYPRRNYTN